MVQQFNLKLLFLIELYMYFDGSIFQKAAEVHLPFLESKEGIFISMDDLDGLHVWSFKYRCKLPFPFDGRNYISIANGVHQGKRNNIFVRINL
jgi:hypothetical protein